VHILINKEAIFKLVGYRIAHLEALWRILAENGKSGNLPDAILTASNGWRA